MSGNFKSLREHLSASVHTNRAGFLSLLIHYLAHIHKELWFNPKKIDKITDPGQILKINPRTTPEKKVTVVEPGQIHKMTISFNENALQSVTGPKQGQNRVFPL